MGATTLTATSPDGRHVPVPLTRVHTLDVSRDEKSELLKIELQLNIYFTQN